MKHFSFIFFLQKEHVIRKHFGLQVMSPFYSVHSPLISWSQLQIFQLGAGLLILVLRYKDIISFSQDSFSNESYFLSGSGPESLLLEEPFDTPNPKPFALSEDVLDVLSVSLSIVMESTVGGRSFRWSSIQALYFSVALVDDHLFIFRLQFRFLCFCQVQHQSLVIDFKDCTYQQLTWAGSLSALFSLIIKLILRSTVFE